MRVVLVNPTFGHYRVPVYLELNKLCGGHLSVVYSADRMRNGYGCDYEASVRRDLGACAVPVTGEKALLSKNWGPESVDSRPGYNIAWQPHLVRTIRGRKPEVIIAEGFFQWSPAAFWSRLTCGVPVVVSYQRTRHTERNNPWWKTAYHRSLARNSVDAFCVNGILCSEYLESLGVKRDRIVTGGIAADTNQFSATAAAVSQDDRAALRQGLGLAGTVFLYVGRLHEGKGVQYLLRAWARIENSSLANTLLIVGDGPHRRHLGSLANDLGLRRVVFTGRVPYQETAKYHALSNVFVMPTLQDNWSLVVPEAMACGLPVLTSKYNGCWPELVHAGVNGFVFDSYDIEDISARMQFFLDNPGSVAPMGEASRRIVADYSPGHAAKALMEACHVACRFKRARRKKCG